MLQVSRNNSLKIPKTIINQEISKDSIEEQLSVKKAIATANNLRFSEKQIKDKLEEDEELKKVSKISFNSNDLVVITTAKKLCAYVITITEKSPKKFRGVFVNRMQNYCLDTIEYLLEANFIKMNTLENKEKREKYQKDAIIKLKLLSYVAMVAESSGCILKKQYKQISFQLADTINLIIAWKKSDDERFKNKNRILG